MAKSSGSGPVDDPRSERSPSRTLKGPSCRSRTGSPTGAPTRTGSIDRADPAHGRGGTGMDVAQRSPVASRVPRAGSRHQPLLGGLLVKEGLINHAQLHRMLTLQQERQPRPLLGQMLLDEK